MEQIIPTLDNTLGFYKIEDVNMAKLLYIIQSLLNYQLTLEFSNMKWILKCSLLINPWAFLCSYARFF